MAYTPNPRLEKEIDAYMSQLPSMLKEHKGKWTVIYQGNPLGFWKSLDDIDYDAVRKIIKDPIKDSLLVREVSEEYLIHGRYGNPHGKIRRIPTPIQKICFMASVS